MENRRPGDQEGQEGTQEIRRSGDQEIEIKRGRGSHQ
jgi:hypothetical protein